MNKKTKETKKTKLLAESPVDPFPNPVLAPTDASSTNINGARYGCSRNGGTKMHRGTDLKAKDGTNFVAIYSGVVQFVRDDVSNEVETPDLGNIVIIKTIGLGISMKYCHLSKILVKVGDNITQGNVLGKTGKSGNAFSVPHKHLHLEVSTDYFVTNSKYVDPEPYLKTKYGPNPNPVVCG